MGGMQSLDRNMPINVEQNYRGEEEKCSVPTVTAADRDGTIRPKSAINYVWDH